MKTRFQFGAFFAAWLAVGLACGSAYSQTPLQQRRAARQQRREEMLAPPNGNAPNGVRPGANANNLPPKAIERLQDMPPNRQEQFLRNNQRFQNLPPEQQAQIRERLQAWNRLTPEQQQNLRDRPARVGADDSRAAHLRSPDPAPALAAIAARPPPGDHAATALAARHERGRPPGKIKRSRVPRRLERRGPRDARATRALARRNGPRSSRDVICFQPLPRLSATGKYKFPNRLPLFFLHTAA